MKSLNLICREIYNAAYIAAGSDYSGAPVAYIHIKAGKKAAELREEIKILFDKLKWNTPLSTADLRIEKDDSVKSESFVIDRIEDFFDDESGETPVYQVHEEDKEILI